MAFTLIAAVQQFEAIWNKRCRDHRNARARTLAWQWLEENTFGKTIPLAQIKKKWQALNSLHCRYIKQRNRKSNKSASRRWSFWDAFEFMRLADRNDVHGSATPPLKLETDESVTESANSGNGLVALGSEDWRNGTPIDFNMYNDNHLHQEAMAALLEPDRFDEFGNYVASELRQMLPELVDSAMAELQCSITVFNGESAATRLRRQRMATAPIITFAVNDEQPQVFYLFGEREEPYDASIHTEIHVLDHTGLLVTDPSLRVALETAARASPTLVAATIEDSFQEYESELVGLPIF